MPHERKTPLTFAGVMGSFCLAIGLMALIAAIFLFFQSSPLDFPFAFASLIALAISYRQAKAQFAQRQAPLETQSSPVAAKLSTGRTVDISLTIMYPPNAPEDDIRFNIPMGIHDETIAYLAQRDELPTSLDLEQHLVFFARRYAETLDLDRLDVRVDSMSFRDPDLPLGGIFIGTD